MAYIIVKILNSYFQDFLYGIETKNVQFNWSKLELRISRIGIKQEVIDKLNLPIQLKLSHIENFIINMNGIKNLIYYLDKPIEITLKGVVLIISPKDKEQWHLHLINSFSKKIELIEQHVKNYLAKIRKQKKENAKKLKILRQKISELIKKKNSKQNRKQEEEEKYVSNRKDKILDNLKFLVEDVHIRYESPLNTYPFAFGITLNRVFSQNVKSNWKDEIFVDRANLANEIEPTIFKNIYLEKFGFYWNSKCQDFYSNLSEEKQITKMHGFKIFQSGSENDKSMFKGSYQKTYEYIFQLDGCMHLKQNLFIKQYSRPKLEMKIQMNKMAFEFSNSQIVDFFSLINFFDNYQIALKIEKEKYGLRPIRPNVQILKSQQMKDKEQRRQVLVLIWQYAISKVRLQILKNYFIKFIFITKCKSIEFKKILTKYQQSKFESIVSRVPIDELYKASIKSIKMVESEAQLLKKNMNEKRQILNQTILAQNDIQLQSPRKKKSKMPYYNMQSSDLVLIDEEQKNSPLLKPDEIQLKEMQNKYNEIADEQQEPDHYISIILKVNISLGEINVKRQVKRQEEGFQIIWKNYKISWLQKKQNFEVKTLIEDFQINIVHLYKNLSFIKIPIFYPSPTLDKQKFIFQLYYEHNPARMKNVVHAFQIECQKFEMLVYYSTFLNIFADLRPQSYDQQFQNYSPQQQFEKKNVEELLQSAQRNDFQISLAGITIIFPQLQNNDNNSLCFVAQLEKILIKSQQYQSILLKNDMIQQQEISKPRKYMQNKKMSNFFKKLGLPKQISITESQSKFKSNLINLQPLIMDGGEIREEKEERINIGNIESNPASPNLKGQLISPTKSVKSNVQSKIEYQNNIISESQGQKSFLSQMNLSIHQNFRFQQKFYNILNFSINQFSVQYFSSMKLFRKFSLYKENSIIFQNKLFNDGFYYNIVENFSLKFDLLFLKSVFSYLFEKPKIVILLKLDDLKINLNSKIYCDLLSISLDNQVSQNEMILKDKKIIEQYSSYKNFISKRSSYQNWTQYYLVFNGSYLYLYSHLDDLDYEEYVNLKNVKVEEISSIIGVPFTIQISSYQKETVFIKFFNKNEKMILLKLLNEKINQNKYINKMKQQQEIQNQNQVKSMEQRSGEFSCQINQIQINIQNLKENKTILEIYFYNIFLFKLQQEFNSEIELYVQNFNITDYLSQIKFLELQRVVSNQPLYQNFTENLKINQNKIFLIAKASFLSKQHADYKNIDSSWSIQMSPLYFNWKRETVQFIYNFIFSFKSKSNLEQYQYKEFLNQYYNAQKLPNYIISNSQHNELEENQSYGNEFSRLSRFERNNSEQDLLIDDQLHEKSQNIKQQLNENNKLIKVEIFIPKISLYFIHNYERTIFKCINYNLKYSYLMTNVKMEINYSIKSFKIVDLTNYPETFSDPPTSFIHSKKQVFNAFELISQKKQKDKQLFIEGALTLYDTNLPSNVLEVPNIYSKSTINVRSFSCIYIQQPFLRLIDYLNEQINAVVMFDYKTSQEVKQDKKYQKKMIEDPFLYQMNIVIISPEIYLKTSPFYEDSMLKIVFEKIIIQNFAEQKLGRIIYQKDIDDLKSIWCDKQIINFHSMQIDYFNMQKKQNKYNIALPISFVAQLDKPILVPWYSLYYNENLILDKSLQIQIIFTNSQMTLTRSSFLELMRIVYNNLIYDDQQECNYIYNYQHIIENKIIPQIVSIQIQKWSLLLLDFYKEINDHLDNQMDQEFPYIELVFKNFFIHYHKSEMRDIQVKLMAQALKANRFHYDGQMHYLIQILKEGWLNNLSLKKYSIEDFIELNKVKYGFDKNEENLKKQYLKCNNKQNKQLNQLEVQLEIPYNHPKTMHVQLQEIRGILNLGMIVNLSNYLSSPDEIVVIVPPKPLKSAQLPFYINFNFFNSIIILDNGRVSDSSNIISIKGKINIAYTMRANTKLRELYHQFQQIYQYQKYDNENMILLEQQKENEPQKQQNLNSDQSLEEKTYSQEMNDLSFLSSKQLNRNSFDEGLPITQLYNSSKFSNNFRSKDNQKLIAQYMAYSTFAQLKPISEIEFLQKKDKSSCYEIYCEDLQFFVTNKDNFCRKFHSKKQIREKRFISRKILSISTIKYCSQFLDCFCQEVNIPGAINKHTQANVQIGIIHGTLALKDLHLLWNTLKQQDEDLTNTIQFDEYPEKLYYQLKAESPFTNNLSVDLSNQFSATISQHSSIFAQDYYTEILNRKFESQRDIYLEKLTMVLINDSNKYLIPLMQVMVSFQPYSKIQDDIKKMTSIELNLMIQFYNPHVSRFEPFIEKSYLRYNSSFGKSSNPKEYITLELNKNKEKQEILNIDLSLQNIKQLLKFYYIWQSIQNQNIQISKVSRDMQDSIFNNKIKSPSLPFSQINASQDLINIFSIQNNAGYDIELIKNKNDERKTQNNKNSFILQGENTIKIANGQQINYNIKYEQTDFEEIFSKPQKLSFQFQIKRNRKIKQVLIKNVQFNTNYNFYCYWNMCQNHKKNLKKLTQKDDQVINCNRCKKYSQQYFYIQQDIQNEQKIIHINSPYLLQNNTNLTIFFLIYYKEEYQDQIVFPPHSISGLPLELFLQENKYFLLITSFLQSQLYLDLEDKLMVKELKNIKDSIVLKEAFTDKYFLITKQNVASQKRFFYVLTDQISIANYSLINLNLRVAVLDNIKIQFPQLLTSLKNNSFQDIKIVKEAFVLYPHQTFNISEFQPNKEYISLSFCYLISIPQSKCEESFVEDIVKFKYINNRIYPLINQLPQDGLYILSNFQNQNLDQKTLLTRNFECNPQYFQLFIYSQCCIINSSNSSFKIYSQHQLLRKIKGKKINFSLDQNKDNYLEKLFKTQNQYIEIFNANLEFIQLEMKTSEEKEINLQQSNQKFDINLKYLGQIGVCFIDNNNFKHEFGINISKQIQKFSSQFEITIKIIEIMPRYIIINKSDITLQICEIECQNEKRIDAQKSTSFNFQNDWEIKKFLLKISEDQENNWQWSGKLCLDNNLLTQIFTLKPFGRLSLKYDNNIYITSPSPYRKNKQIKQINPSTTYSPMKQNVKIQNQSKVKKQRNQALSHNFDTLFYRLEVYILKASYMLLIQKETEGAYSYQIVNKTIHFNAIYEQKSFNDEKNAQYACMPQQSTPFGWENPSEKSLILLVQFQVNDQNNAFHPQSQKQFEVHLDILDQIQKINLNLDDLDEQNFEYKIQILTTLEGKTKCLIITEEQSQIGKKMENQYFLNKKQLTSKFLTNRPKFNSSRLHSLQTLNKQNELENNYHQNNLQKIKKVNQMISVHLKQCGISIILQPIQNLQRQEFCYILGKNIDISIFKSDLQMLNFKMEKINIDYNSEQETIYPVILSTSVNKEKFAAIDLEIQWYPNYVDILYLKFVKLKVQPLLCKFEETSFILLYMTLQLSNETVDQILNQSKELHNQQDYQQEFSIWKSKDRYISQLISGQYYQNFKLKQVISLENPFQDWEWMVISSQKINYYFKQIHLSDIKIYFSYYCKPQQNQQGNLFTITQSRDAQKTLSFQFLNKLANLFGSFATNIDSAPLQLHSFQNQNLLISKEKLFNQILQQYKVDLLTSFLMMIGSLEIIGNPVGLFFNFAQGINEISIHTNFDYGIGKGGVGFLIGIGGLIKHFIAGSCNSLEKISGSLGGGLVSLSNDQDFQTVRNSLKITQSSNLFYGIYNSFQLFLNGIIYGLTGIIRLPLQGASQQGAFGGLLGSAYGISGLVIKPISGVLDATSKITESLKNAVTIFDEKPNNQRVRPIRVFYGSQRYFKDYKLQDSTIFNALYKHYPNKLIFNGYYKISVECEEYFYNSLIILMNDRFQILTKNCKKIIYEIKFSSIIDLAQNDNDISLLFKTNKKQFQLKIFIQNCKEQKIEKILNKMLFLIQSYSEELNYS